jgi:hypothetical protein
VYQEEQECRRANKPLQEQGGKEGPTCQDTEEHQTTIYLWEYLDNSFPHRRRSLVEVEDLVVDLVEVGQEDQEVLEVEDLEDLEVGVIHAVMQVRIKCLKTSEMAEVEEAEVEHLTLEVMVEALQF